MPPETETKPDETTDEPGFVDSFVQQITEEADRREAQSTGSTVDGAGGVSISPSTPEEDDGQDEDTPDAADEQRDEADVLAPDASDETGAAGTLDTTPEAAAPPAAGPVGPSPEDVAAGQQLLSWFRGLSPDAMHGIDLYLSGQYVLVPREQAATPQVQQQSSPPDDDDDEDFLDPRAKREIERLRQEVQSIRQTEQQTIAQQQAAREQEYLRIGQEVTNTFATNYGLSEAETQRVMAVTANLGIINGLMKETSGDYSAALARAYETAMYVDPELRAKVVTPPATTPTTTSTTPPQVEIDANAHAAMVERRKRAGAVSSGGGSTPRTAPPPKDHTTAMAEELAAAMGKSS